MQGKGQLDLNIVNKFCIYWCAPFTSSVTTFHLTLSSEDVPSCVAIFKHQICRTVTSVRAASSTGTDSSFPTIASTLEKKRENMIFFKKHDIQVTVAQSNTSEFFLFFFISSELLSMPAVKRFSVSFAKHPTNGTSASFKYFSTSPPFVLHVFKLLFFDLGVFFPHGPPAFQVSVIYLFSNYLIIFFCFFLPICFGFLLF